MILDIKIEQNDNANILSTNKIVGFQFILLCLSHKLQPVCN
jgi:hypothetical protein